MKQEHKLYAALGVVLALGVAVYAVRADKKQTQEALAPTGAVADLPLAKLTKEQTDKVTKLTVKGEKGEVVLEKKGDNWEIVKPIGAKANDQNVKSTLENLQKIEVEAKISDTADVHDKYDLVDDKAVHIVAYEGDKAIFDWYFGKSGSRGHMARQGGEGASAAVYATKGYSSFLFDREIKNWRHNEIVKFEDANVVAAEVENEAGKLSFTKDGDDWKGKIYSRGKDGELAGKAKDIEKFDAARVKDMLRALKNLRATDFAAEGADTGVDEPIASGGGVVRITMKDEDAPKYVLTFGKKQEGTNRYVASEGDGTIYVVTSWAADFATSGVDKYQKADEEETVGGDDDHEGHGHGDDDGHGHGDAGAKAPEAKDKAPKAPKAPAPKPEAPAPKPEAPAPKPEAPATP